MNTLYVILPCYNEQDNVETLIDNWCIQKTDLYDKGYNLKIIAIDDKSTDNTKDIIQEQILLHKEISPLFHTENQGLGGGLLNGLTLFAVESAEGDIVIVMDADNTHDPHYAFTMIEQIESGSDCAIASRYCSASRAFGIAPYRSMLSTCAKLYYQIVLGIPNIKDYTCGFRAYRASIIKKAHMVYKDKLVVERSFACMMELLYKLYQIDAKITEVPFELRYDFKQGKSKMKVMKTIQASIITAMKLRLNLEMR